MNTNENLRQKFQPSKWNSWNRGAHGCSSSLCSDGTAVCARVSSSLFIVRLERKCVKSVVKNAEVRTAFILLLAGDLGICEWNPSQLLNIIGSVLQHIWCCHFSLSFKSKLSPCWGHGEPVSCSLFFPWINPVYNWKFACFSVCLSCVGSRETGARWPSPLFKKPLHSILSLRGEMTARSFHTVTAASGIFILKGCLTPPHPLPLPPDLPHLLTVHMLIKNSISGAALRERQPRSLLGKVRHSDTLFLPLVFHWAHCKQLSVVVVPRTHAVLKIHKAAFVRCQLRTSCRLNCNDLCRRAEETSGRDLAEAVWSHTVGKGGVFTAVSDQSLQRGFPSLTAALRSINMAAEEGKRYIKARLNI